MISERKRKSSTGDSEGENFKKEKQRKSSERKKVRRSGEKIRGKDAKDDSENVNQHSGKHKESEKVTKNHMGLDQNVNINKDRRDGINSIEYIGKSQTRTEKEQNDRISSLSHKFGTTKPNDTQVCSDSESSNIIRKDSGKLHGDRVNFKRIGMLQNAPDSHNRSDEIQSGKSGYRKISLAGKTNISSKIICNSLEESSNVPECSVLNPIKKVTGSVSEIDVTKHGILGSIEEKTPAEIKPSAAVHLQPVSRPKIVLMQSDDDDDDDEDFINIKADAEAGKAAFHCNM